MKILIIDNYDSFTYNLYQICGETLSMQKEPFTLDVIRNDEIDLQTIKSKKYDRIIISPGPGNPRDPKYFGICKDVLLKLGKNIPTLGVCLGMQGMAYYFGGKIIQAKKPMHGKISLISHDGKGIFTKIPQKINVMRYHSLIVDKKTLPECLIITALTFDTKKIMGLRHKEYPIEGIQFHPESFATEGGKFMLQNFLFQK
ncbi:MAG: aminodeoxychorismate/anthranilate synthase component II [bacterium]|nr:aminodeoxychorismate/anthranilate synthase component II [bacterium]